MISFDIIFYLSNNAVMLMGRFLYNIRYTMPEYFCSGIVAGGVCLFALLKVRSIFEDLSVFYADYCFSCLCKLIMLFADELQDYK